MQILFSLQIKTLGNKALHLYLVEKYFEHSRNYETAKTTYLRSKMYERLDCTNF